MIAQDIDPAFRAALRDRLVEFARQPSSSTTTRLAIIGGLSLLLLAGGGVAVAGVIGALPGGEDTTQVGEAASYEGSGAGSLTLAPVTGDANKIRLELTCESAGTFTFPADAGEMTCTADDIGTPRASAWIDLPLTEVGDTLSVGAGAGEQWRLTATYLRADPLPLGVNANGDTFGVGGGPDGEPDLIAVVATNGRSGYVYADALAAADGTTAAEGFRSPEDALEWQERNKGIRHAVPVYLEDGETVIGEFVIG